MLAQSALPDPRTYRRRTQKSGRIRNSEAGARFNLSKLSGSKFMRQAGIALLLFLAGFGVPAARQHIPRHSYPPEALQITPDGVNAATLQEPAALENLSPELAIRLQVMLDRAHFSPGWARLDRARKGSGLRHSWLRRAGQSQQDRFPWLHKADKLGRAGACVHGASRNPC
jgi:hypothetical protein